MQFLISSQLIVPYPGYNMQFPSLYFLLLSICAVKTELEMGSRES